MEKQEILSKTTLFKKTLPYIKQEKKLFIITIILSIVISILSAVTPFITKRILDVYLPNYEYNMVAKALIVYGVIVFVTVITRYIYQYANQLTGMHIEKTVREKAIRKID